MTKRNLSKMKAATVIERARIKREIRDATRGETAKQALGTIKPGCEIFGFTKGQFSFVDLLDAILWQTGPADVVVATWTAASADLTRVKAWLTSDRLLSCRFMVDFSFERRQPAFCATMRECFGDDAIRVTVTHAKFAIIRAKKRALVVRTSMNLNHNPRFENFEISDDPKLARFLDTIIAEVWKTQSAGEGFENRPSENKRQFGGILSSQPSLGADLVDHRDVI